MRKLLAFLIALASIAFGVCSLASAQVPMTGADSLSRLVAGVAASRSLLHLADRLRLIKLLQFLAIQ
jgi:hypothetical protein